KLVNAIGGMLSAEETDGKQRIEVQIEVESGSPLEETTDDKEKLEVTSPRDRRPNVRITQEPSLPELIRFKKNLSNTRVHLHSQDRSIFGRHLNHCLTHWGMQVQHISFSLGRSDDEAEDENPPVEPTTAKRSGG